jgi:hypothetical protein
VVAEERPEQDRLQDQVEQLIVGLLADGSWVPVDELEQRIPEELAETRGKMTLLASGKYETGWDNGKERSRLIERPVPATKGADEPETLKPAAAQTTPAEPNANRGSPELPFHELGDLLPSLEGDEYEELKTDILKNGRQENIVVYAGQIVDGRIWSPRLRLIRRKEFVQPILQKLCLGSTVLIARSLTRLELTMCRTRHGSGGWFHG